MNLFKKSKWELMVIMAILMLVVMPTPVSAATVTSVTVTGIVEPVTGQKPNNNTIVDNSSLYNHHHTAWQRCSDSSMSSCTDVTMSGADTFVVGQYYRVVVIVEATEGNVFSNTLTKATINSQPATVHLYNSECIYVYRIFQAKHTYGFTLTPASDYNFPAKTVGYSAIDEYSFVVQSTSSAMLTINANLSGNASAFELRTLNYGTNTNNIQLGTGGGKIAFYLSPKTGLAPGTYNASVKISGANVTSQSFKVSFTVDNAAPVKYSVTMQNDGNGTASASTSSATGGTVVNLTASPKTGYQFKSWQVVSGGVTISDNKFTMGSSNVTVKALFEKLPDAQATTAYTITVKNGVANKTKSIMGEKITITANPAPGGKVFDKWTSPNEGIVFDDVTAMSTAFGMLPGNVTIEATYKDLPAGTFAINVLTNGNGTAEANVLNAKSGDIVTLNTAPNEGYKFVKWLVTSSDIKIADNQFIMPDETVTLEAVFENITDTPKEETNDFNKLWIIFGILAVTATIGGIHFIIMRKKEKAQSIGT